MAALGPGASLSCAPRRPSSGRPPVRGARGPGRRLLAAALLGLAAAPAGLLGWWDCRTVRAFVSGRWLPAGLARVQVQKPRAALKASLQLFGSQGSRSPLINWYLEEIGQAYEMVDLRSVDRSAPSFPHPFGQIPALRDGEVEVFESGAILLYLAQKYGGLGTAEALATVAKWVVWANASLDPVVFKENENGQVLDTGLRGRPKRIERLEGILEGKTWLVGEEFSVADVAVASYLLYGLMFFPDVNIGKWPNIARYLAAAARRPAYAKAFGPQTAQMLASRCAQAPAEEKLFGIF